MKKNIPISIIIMLIVFLMSICVAFAVPTGPHMFYGTVTINNTLAPIGTIINATIDGASAGTITTTAAGAYGGSGITLAVSGAEGNTITFYATITDYGSIGTLTTTFHADNLTEMTLAFVGTYTGGAAVVDTGGDTGGAGGPGPSAPEEEDVDIVAPTLGLDADDVESIIQFGDTKVTTETVTVGELNELIASEAVSDPAAVEALEELIADLEKEGMEQIEITKTLDVFKVTMKGSTSFSYRSRIMLEFVPETSLKNVRIIVVIPKTVANHISEITFIDLQPTRILQADPVAEFIIPSVIKGQKVSITYIVNKRLTSVDSTILGVGSVEEDAPEVEPTSTTLPPEEEELPPTPEELEEKKTSAMGIIIMLLVLVVALGGYILWSRKKK